MLWSGQRNATRVGSLSDPDGARYSYEQFAAVNAGNFAAISCAVSPGQCKIFGVLSSFDIDRKSGGKMSLLSPAQILAARQICFRLLTHWLRIACSRAFSSAACSCSFAISSGSLRVVGPNLRMMEEPAVALAELSAAMPAENASISA